MRRMKERGARGRRRPAAVVVIAAAAALVTTGCGSGSTSSALPRRYCDAVKTISFHDDGLRGDTDPDKIKAAYTKVVADLASPLAAVAADGPPRAKEAVGPWRRALEKSRDEGVDTFDQQAEAGTAIVKASAAGCGWQEHTIATVDYRYEGVPATWKAGVVVVTLENRSEKEPHLFLAARVKDGVSKPLDQLVAQFAGPDTPGDADIEFVNGGTFAPPGSSASGLVELRPGRYIYLCPLPVAGSQSETDDHARHGMAGEFTVT